MNLLKKYIPFHFLIGLLLGVLVQFYTELWHFGFLWLFSFLFIGLLVLLVFYKINRPVLFTLSSCGLFVFIGMAVLYSDNPKHYDKYFEKKIKDNSSVIIEVSEVLKSNKDNYRYYANLIQVDSLPTCGRVLVSVKKDSLTPIFRVGQRVLSKGDFKELPINSIPYAFDYSDYLNKRYIYKQLFLDTYKCIDDTSYSLYTIAQNFRVKIQKTLLRHHFSSDTFGLINALLLGDKTFITDDIKEDYIDAGVIHILAISGLHIGIILFILQFLFSPLNSIKYWRVISSLVIVLLLWAFAFVCGLSASVLRAVTMFSFIVLGRLMERKTYIEHSLIASMLFLVLIKPLFIFDIGFQLSYLAVFGIIWIRPLLMRVFKVKLNSYVKELITVSLSAQLSVLPLSLYYFHQFPSLFIVSNLLIIPFLTIILGYGIVVIVCSLLGVNFGVVYNFYDYIIRFLNNIVGFISSYEDYILKNISMSFYQMLMWYVLIFCLLRLFTDFRPRRMIEVLLSVLVLQFTYLSYNIIHKNNSELIVFSQAKYTMIGINDNGMLQVFTDANNTDKVLGNYIRERQVGVVNIYQLPNVFKYKTDRILVVDSLGMYNIPKLKPSIVILSQSPKINLERLINTLKPKQIIADASNYKTYVERWRNTCGKLNVDFYSIYENGCFKK